MKLVTYSHDGTTRAGVVQEDRVYPIDGAETLLDVIGDGLDAVLQRGEQAVSAGEYVALDDVRLEAPVRPPQMRDSMCFHEHIQNGLGEVADDHKMFPTFYISNAAAVHGPADEVRISPGSENFDYELEVAAVIGKPGTNIAPSDAGDHIIGYTMYIDWSARDLQGREMSLRLGPAKGKDSATTLGPVLVTADELEPLRTDKGFDVPMTVAINGKPLSAGNWSSINWTFDDVVAYTSRGTTLQTGDVLGSGTVGRGCLLEHYRIDRDNFPGWLSPGDVVTFEAGPIGRLDITVAEPLPRHPLSSGY
ncbi:DUF2437 domain-containing protein [Epidermidibacterium keratini]|uniref:DUF2437 domain-containing protein n=1 Tax=Epidermidibacterium keratini TaxID=1891644 RepID=A0A7L4YRT1_9ACTN|nr:fumarylacetoacetate hydrolase family protein [Epidermidibacterium keratini]QHC01673.1 DUF2437 domain-containing protein [Epidermidibacterium keratini]